MPIFVFVVLLVPSINVLSDYFYFPLSLVSVPTDWIHNQIRETAHLSHFFFSFFLSPAQLSNSNEPPPFFTSSPTPATRDGGLLLLRRGGGGGSLRPKRVPFSSLRYMKRYRDFTLSIRKGKKNCYYGLWKDLTAVSRNLSKLISTNCYEIEWKQTLKNRSKH